MQIRLLVCDTWKRFTGMQNRNFMTQQYLEPLTIAVLSAPPPQKKGKDSNSLKNKITHKLFVYKSYMFSNLNVRTVDFKKNFSVT